MTTTSPHSSAKNGAAERAIRTAKTHVRCDILAAGLPKTLWPYAALDAVNNLNTTSRRAPNDPSLRPISPYELFYGFMAFSGQRSTYSHLANADTSCTPDSRQSLHHVLRSLVSCAHTMSTSTSSHS
jgi:hypothetical protein